MLIHIRITLISFVLNFKVNVLFSQNLKMVQNPYVWSRHGGGVSVNDNAGGSGNASVNTGEGMNSRGDTTKESSNSFSNSCEEMV